MHGKLLIQDNPLTPMKCEHMQLQTMVSTLVPQDSPSWPINQFVQEWLMEPQMTAVK